jgi:arginine deiminase
VGKLETVLLHRPGKELERLTPQYLEELLFDDIPWLGRIQVEHELFAKVLSDRGTRVYYYDKLLSDILKQDSVKKDFIEELCRFSGLDRLKEGEAIAITFLPVNPRSFLKSL